MIKNQAMTSHNRINLLTYDDQNIFARILRKEIPCTIIYETLHTLVFQDQYPKAPVHLLMIPKGKYTCAEYFFSQATDEEILDFSRTIGQLPRHLLCTTGFKLISNQDTDADQEVPHFHVHFLAQQGVLPNP